NLFNSPTIWAWEFSSMLLVIYIAIAGGYTMLMDGHIRMDLFYERFSPRKQAVIDIVFVFLFFFYMGMLTWHLSTIAGDSFSIKEHSFSAWAPPLYPIKILLPIATFMTLLQGVAKLIRDFNTILGYEAL
ncbi:MAG: TRAP transporter small permease subunit, partial [Deltaproteobacteria bacterium]|nr:TRAP transporter small permease subunit [Deltaproteobacteria bacterium]